MFRGATIVNLPPRQVSGVSYSLCCFSEPLRISKMCSVFAGALCPISEKRVAVLTSEGRVLVWGVEFEQVGMRGGSGNKGGGEGGGEKGAIVVLENGRYSSVVVTREVIVVLKNGMKVMG